MNVHLCVPGTDGNNTDFAKEDLWMQQWETALCTTGSMRLVKKKRTKMQSWESVHADAMWDEEQRKDK